MPDVRLDNAPSLGSSKNDTNSLIGGLEELSTERGNSALVKLSRLDQFRLGIRVVNQSHPMARRAACITCSCVRPVTVPEDNS